MTKTTLYLCTLLVASAATSQATTITYITPLTSSTGGGPVNASATFTTGAGTLSITLTDLLANPSDVAQLLSDLDFTLSNGATSGTLTSSSGQEITVNGGGSFTLGSTVPTGWGVKNDVMGGIQLDAIGFIGPAHLIIGPPSGGTYSNANGSIAGNGPHNSFLNQTATFNLSIAGVTAATTITSATFSFGTIAGVNVAGTPSAVPDPATAALLGFGLIVLGMVRKTTRKA